MSALAVRTGAINLGQGFPDTEVLVTAGATEAIAASLLALVEPGDEVVALEPYYDSYAASIALAGGTRVPVTLRPRDGAYHLDLDELRDAVTPRTRLILLNTPHNPTGTVLTRDELAAVAALAVERDLLVVTDEVYEHLVLDGEHLPLASFPGMRERTVTISSSGKTFSFTGWKVGWVTATPELVTTVRAQFAPTWGESSTSARRTSLRLCDTRRPDPSRCSGAGREGGMASSPGVTTRTTVAVRPGDLRQLFPKRLRPAVAAGGGRVSSIRKSWSAAPEQRPWTTSAPVMVPWSRRLRHHPVVTGRMRKCAAAGGPKGSMRNCWARLVSTQSSRGSNRSRPGPSSMTVRHPMLCLGWCHWIWTRFWPTGSRNTCGATAFVQGR
ncbi:aminotransferase class I/II-fold pyridoxal phosphate-dependent enzyme [Streptomyces niveus]|uniref:aminotransferase class I/II-fold pyridoxal phosphate-dependent enzyme n=1 Tax=Streptomyces niveus TaxID=193462 RepID=UPI003CCBDEBB